MEHAARSTDEMARGTEHAARSTDENSRVEQISTFLLKPIYLINDHAYA